MQPRKRSGDGKRAPTAFERSGSISPADRKMCLTTPRSTSWRLDWSKLRDDGSVRGLVIRSAKPAGFCAGPTSRESSRLKHRPRRRPLCVSGLAVFDHLSGLAVPTLAVIHGACLGGGLELALACRRRVALASAAPIQIGMPEVHFGLIPAWGGISRIPRIVGPDDGLNLLITGRTIGYLLARSHGIVDRLASEGDSIESLDLLSSDPADRTDMAQRGLGRRPGIARGKRLTSNLASIRRPSSRSSRSSR